MVPSQKHKERSSDRVLVLKPLIDEKVISSTGMVDARLFKGGNALHAIMDKSNCLWALKYESGGMPEPLKQKFPSFSTAYQAAVNYYSKRGLEITEVID